MHSFIGENCNKKRINKQKNTERNKGVATVRDIYLSGEQLEYINKLFNKDNLELLKEQNQMSREILIQFCI